MPAAIGDYAIIGDGRSCALVATTGSIDLLCWPHFDSDACLAALLGDERHGCWRLAPSGFIAATTRGYCGDTAILETSHETDRGRVRVTDLMPWHDGDSALIRIVDGLAGEVEMTLSLQLRFGYGQIAPWIQPDPRGLQFEVGPHRVLLDSPEPLAVCNGEASARFTVTQGTRRVFVLSYSSSTQSLPAPLAAEALADATQAAWTQWVGGYRKRTDWDAAVRRSLITLRLLTDRRSGGIVAAASFGLPEIPGGAANWDYRYCWLRDSTFTLTALLNAGFHEEAQRWRDWILRAVAGQPAALQIVYRIDGSPRLEEHEAAGLPGYQGATPVRIGNAASGQRQLDVFGEVMDSFEVLAQAGIARTPRVVAVETAIVTHLEKVWDQPSSDIWENRAEPRCYTYSQVMAWVGITRFIRAHREDDRIDAALMGRLTQLREVIHRTVCERGYRPDLGHFVQYYGGEGLDASLLLLPLVGFLPVGDPRIASTIAAVERELMEGGLVRRKPPKAGGPEEGAFLACSCWLADCYRMQGRIAEARALLERVIGLGNDVGLLSEEYDVPGRRLAGNVPQALTHLALVNTALFLSGSVIQRAGG